MDKLLDTLAEKIAKKNKSIYKFHEKLAYEKYRKTAIKAGLKPLSKRELKRLKS